VLKFWGRKLTPNNYPPQPTALLALTKLEAAEPGWIKEAIEENPKEYITRVRRKLYTDGYWTHVDAESVRFIYPSLKVFMSGMGVTVEPEDAS